MRILDNRYSRDLRKHDLALRMIRHEARTLTIRAWTGLSDTRIRSLFRSYLPRSGGVTARHRGPPPTRLTPLLRSKPLSAEAAGLAGLCLALCVLPAKPLANAARELPSLGTGERLCYAFELYQQIIPRPQISFDLLVLLVTALAERVEVALAHCDRCDAAMLLQLLEKPSRLCPRCALERGRGTVSQEKSLAAAQVKDESEAQAVNEDPLEGFQRPLF